MERVLPYPDALTEVLNRARKLPLPASTEEVELLGSRGRVLACDVVADRHQPPFPRSTRDGFAVRSADITGDAEVVLHVVGSVRAGEQWNGPALQPGAAIEIMTGAPVPDGADAVLMLEHAQLTETRLQPQAGRRLTSSENVVPTGAEAHAGTVLVPAGRRIQTPEISVAASCGCSSLKVYSKPVVAIIATGDELVELDTSPASWQIRNSNGYSLASLVEDDGGVPKRLAVARDSLTDLRARIAAAGSADLILFSGGVSMGKYDLVEAALREAGAEFFFTGALIQPGKPIVFGDLSHAIGSRADPSNRSQRRIPFFGLPGNPISTEVCFRLFVSPLLRALAGETKRVSRFAEAVLAEDVQGGARVTRFLPASVESAWDGVTVRPVPWRGSGDLAANVRANAFVVLPMSSPNFTAGDRVRVLLR